MTRIGVLGAAVVGGLVGGFVGAALATRLGTGSTGETEDGAEGRRPAATAGGRQRAPETRTQQPDQTPHGQQASADRRRGGRETQPQQGGGGTDRQGQGQGQSRRER